MCSGCSRNSVTERCLATSSAQVPLDEVMDEGVRGEADVGVLATRDPMGAVAVLHLALP